MELMNSQLSYTYRTPFQAAKVFYLLFWLLKPFYLIESGSMQIGDICLGIAFLMVVFSDEMHLRVCKEDVPLLLFVIAVAFINATYAVICQSAEFIKPILYFVFNFMCVYVTRIFLEDYNFIGKWNSVLKLNLILQLIVYVLGMGRWYSSVRYMGTYNDPNQLGFALLSTYCMIYCLNRKQHTKYQWVFFLIAMFLIIQSSSIGMFLGIILVFVFEQYFRLARIGSGTKKAWYMAYLVVISGVLVYVGGHFLLVVIGNGDTDIYVIRRIANKISGGTLLHDFIKDRALDAVFGEPIKMLYGVGEGVFRRLNSRGAELHSTWLSLLYYYGIGPFCLLIAWMKNNLKKIDWYILPVYICVFAEAFTLINHRQPSFWVLILLGSFLKRTQKTSRVQALETGRG